MEIKEKDKLLLLYEETSNLIKESEEISQQKLRKLDSIIDSKVSIVKTIVKDHSLDIQKFKTWIGAINKNEKEIKQYTSNLDEISKRLDNNLSLNNFECGTQSKFLDGLKDTSNLIKTIEIREKKQKKELEEMISTPVNSLILAEKLKNIVSFYEDISGIRIEKDKNEKDTLLVHAFEGYNLLNDLKSCDFSIKYKNGNFHIIKMNPIFNSKPYEDEINEEKLEGKNLGVMLGKIIINEFSQYVIT